MECPSQLALSAWPLYQYIARAASFHDLWQYGSTAGHIIDVISRGWRTMGLDILFVEDVRNALLAADEASSSTARVFAAVGGDQVTPRAEPRDEALRDYLEDYRAALTTVALAFGLSSAIIGGRDPSSCSGQEETLEVEARTVGEALPAGGEDDASPSARPAS